MRLAIVLLPLYVRTLEAGKLRKTLKEVSKHFDALSPAEHVTDVAVGVYFDHLYEVNDVARRFSSDFYLTYQWKDPRWANESWQDFIAHDLTEKEVTCRRAGATSHTPSKNPAQAGKCGQAQHFLELGHDEVDLIWTPDLHIRNIYLGNEKMHSEMLRIYMDGTIELILFTWALLDMVDPDYSLFPFDKQDLTIMIESLSHTTKRIIMHPLHEFTGLEESLTHHWPGWKYDSHEEYAYNTQPEYVHANTARKEERSRIKFVVHVHRHFDIMTMLPEVLLVSTSFAGFFIRTAPDVRLATCFISYLTISQVAQSQLALIPQVTYAVWYAIFLSFCQYAVFLSLLESVIAVCLDNRVSGRVAKMLDRCSRFILTGDFFLILILMLSLNDNPDHVSKLHIFSKANLLVMIVIQATFAATATVYIRRKLLTNPLAVYMSGLEPLDDRECEFVFHDIVLSQDHNVEKDNSIIPSQIVNWLFHRPPISEHADLKAKAPDFQKTLESIFGTGHMTLEEFRSHQVSMFIELRRFVHQSKDFERQKSFISNGGEEQIGPDSLDVEVMPEDEPPEEPPPEQPLTTPTGGGVEGRPPALETQVSELCSLLRQHIEQQQDVAEVLKGLSARRQTAV